MLKPSGLQTSVLQDSLSCVVETTVVFVFDMKINLPQYKLYY